MMNADVEMRRVEKLVQEARRYKNLGYDSTFLGIVKQINALLEKIVIFTRKEMKK